LWGVTSYTNVCSKNVLVGEINDFILNECKSDCIIYCIIKAEKDLLLSLALMGSSSCRHRRTLKYQSVCGGTCLCRQAGYYRQQGANVD
jgi:predicted nucleic acid-binding Zn finger protein